MTEQHFPTENKTGDAGHPALLADRLQAYAARDVLPMHMPGHKRNLTRYPWLAELSMAEDITEIGGFDDVVETGRFPGVTSFLSVNGSTGAILSAVRTAVRPGDRLIMARNCHKAVYHAAEICGARPSYLLPDWDADWGIYSRVRPETVEAALTACTEKPAAVILTSPTYEGDVSDIRAIADTCHARGVPLIVDEAHGAHFSLPGFPESAVFLGADIVIQSLHKTLPSPTQTAIVHSCGDLLSAGELRRQLLLFQSSSPSFLLMAAAEKCVDWVRAQGDAEAEAWTARIKTVRGALKEIGNLRLRTSDDPSKLLIASALSGEVWMERLRSRHAIEAEMAVGSAVLFMTGMGDTDEGMERFVRALREEDAALPPLSAAPHSTAEAPALPEAELEPWRAVRLPGRLTPANEAAGLVSADYVWKVPPGVPFLVPGERITRDAVQKAVANGVKALYTLL